MGQCVVSGAQVSEETEACFVLTQMQRWVALTMAIGYSFEHWHIHRLGNRVSPIFQQTMREVAEETIRRYHEKEKSADTTSCYCSTS